MSLTRFAPAASIARHLQVPCHRQARCTPVAIRRARGRDVGDESPRGPAACRGTTWHMPSEAGPPGSAVENISPARQTRRRMCRSCRPEEPWNKRGSPDLALSIPSSETETPGGTNRRESDRCRMEEAYGRADHGPTPGDGCHATRPRHDEQSPRRFAVLPHRGGPRGPAQRATPAGGAASPGRRGPRPPGRAWRARGRQRS